MYSIVQRVPLENGQDCELIGIPFYVIGLQSLRIK